MKASGAQPITGGSLPEVRARTPARPAAPVRLVEPAVACFFAALAHASPALSAQQPVAVSGEVTCADCVITLDTVATIGGRDDFGLHVITPFSQVAVDRRGRVLITHLSYPEISIFDLDGDFLGTVGREGDRPGEYDGIAHVNAGRRFVHVFEFHRGRTMLDLGFEVARTDRSLGRVLSSVVIGSDEVAFAVPVPEPASVGHQLRILDARGRITSFGGGDPVAPGPQPHRFVVAGDDETFCAVRQQANRVVRWNLAPEPVVAAVFDRTVEPFERDNPSEQLWPRALNVGAMLDDEGLWIAWQTPDPEWTDRIGPGGEIPEVPWQTVLDGWLDLIDPATGRTLARHRGDDALLGFAHGSRYVVSYHEPNSGGAHIHLLEPRLSRGTR